MVETPRRTQAERKGATRAALLRSTIACILEQGYARTTTTEITKHAGVSQGSLFQHFPTKSALIAAAAEQLFAGTIEQFSAALANSTEDEAPLVLALRRLWEVFCSPQLAVVYRLYAEAPVDSELMAALVPVVIKHNSNVRARALALMPELAASPENRAIFGALLYAMQGLSVQRAVYVDAAEEALILKQFEVLAHTFFPAPPKGFASHV